MRFGKQASSLTSFSFSYPCPSHLAPVTHFWTKKIARSSLLTMSKNESIWPDWSKNPSMCWNTIAWFSVGHLSWWNASWAVFTTTKFCRGVSPTSTTQWLPLWSTWSLSWGARQLPHAATAATWASLLSRLERELYRQLKMFLSGLLNANEWSMRTDKEVKTHDLWQWQRRCKTRRTSWG